jgi:hypothetical protein
VGPIAFVGFGGATNASSLLMHGWTMKVAESLSSVWSVGTAATD